MVLFPLGMSDWATPFLGLASWREVFGLLATVGIAYGAMVALVQKDFKFVIGYSSVSHMGFVLLGLMTLSTIGLSGAVLQMFSHGIIAGLLFGVVGRMVYDRTHTRQLDELENLRLSKSMPFAAVTFVVAGLASMGMPGFSGFVAEFQVLIGAWKSFPTFAVIAGVGVVIGVAYTLRAVQKAFFNDAPEVVAVGGGTAALGGAPKSHDAAHEWDDISVPERIGTVILIATTLIVGLYPRVLLDLIIPALNSPLMEKLVKGGAQ
jgi:NADH-quinone oxidoreductase subunit M